ncbi:MAG: N-6 DNA methylase, partial [Nitrosopumilaceae archaeon]
YLQMISAMEIKKLDDIRRNGKYYTPESLAEFLARPLIRDTTESVFDPAYGDGALLLAADKIAQEQKACSFIEVYGCDKAPVNGLLQKIPASQLVKENFFRYKPDKKFDIILMNPPYVRHHLMSESAWSLYQKATNPILQLNSYSDLWAYFLIKATRHLKKIGSIGAILPWSFLQAEYAQNVRVWLAGNFGRIKVLALGSNYFDTASERVLLLWLENYGTTVEEIRYGYSYQIDHEINYFKINKRAWEAQAVVVSAKSNVESIVQTYINKYGFEKFNNFADVKIGIVTGADDFFILDKIKANSLALPNKCLIPILKSSRELAGPSMNGSIPSNMLLSFSKNNSEETQRYIRAGSKKGYNHRSHSKRRTPWYYVNPGETPNAFFPYRCSHSPYLMLNTHKVQSTNSIHRIYFDKRLSENQIRWIQMTLLSAPGQLSLEANSRVYGEGVLKIEPSSLGNAIAHKGDGKFPDRVYQQITVLLVSNQKEKAVEIATKTIADILGVSTSLSQNTSLLLSELKNRRLNNLDLPR